jgi:predicted nuclease of restriction endonuclease-like (RecB) superfamily
MERAHAAGRRSRGCSSSGPRSSESRKELAVKELEALRDEDRPSADLVFRDHYVLDFLGLKDT